MLVDKKLVTALTIIILQNHFIPKAECRWRFPGATSRDGITEEAEEKLFLKTMEQLKKVQDSCNFEESQSALSDIETFIASGTQTVSAVAEKVKSHREKLCRLDFGECDKATGKCKCSNDGILDSAMNTCRFRIGWPCTDGEEKKPKQCVKESACRPWEGSFSYDTETFPKASKFFTDSGTFTCRCNEGSACEGDDDTKSATPSGSCRWNMTTMNVIFVVLSLQLILKGSVQE